MITGPVERYTEYRHKETGRIVEVHNPHLQVKIENNFGGNANWITCVQYQPRDQVDASFAVPVDDFRKKFDADLDATS